jgi:DNA adenine methylase
MLGHDDAQDVEARPFLKWAGGKTQLLSEILPALPRRIATYYEPFLGGGAVFFALANEGRFRRAVLNDRNPELVETYRTVRDSVDALIEALSEHSNNAADEAYFYRVRAERPEALGRVERAARIIFLNKTCFNGLYRVNKQGRFNVPFGRYKNPKLFDEGVLRAASRALARAEILEGDFEDVVRNTSTGDAVYFDPPYAPVSSTASFTSYVANAFGVDEQERLLMVYERCVRRGVRTILSNSHCAFTEKLYDKLDWKEVAARRSINSKGGRRGAISEVLVVGLESSTPGVASVLASKEILVDLASNG